MKPETYIKRATKRIYKNKNYTEQRRTLGEAFQGGSYLLGADGFRAHLVFGDYPLDANSENVDLYYPANALMAQFERGRNWPDLATFTPWHIVQICKAVDGFFIDNHSGASKKQYHQPPYLRVSANGSMDFLAHESANGTLRASLEDGYKWMLKKSAKPFHYEFRGEQPLAFYINPKFLIDALKGIETNVVLRCQPNGSAIYLADEDSEHEAFLMLLTGKHIESRLVKEVLSADQAKVEVMA